jgi:hypothetical protein
MKKLSDRPDDFEQADAAPGQSFRQGCQVERPD